MTLDNTLSSSARDPHREQATSASRIQGSETPTPFVGPANDWQSHGTHSSDAKLVRLICDYATIRREAEPWGILTTT